MLNNNKIKVAWICHFSNKKINQMLPLKAGGLFAFLYRLYKGRELSTDVADFGVWNINALNEMKKYTDKVELHIIAPYPHLETKVHEYEEDGIYYFADPGILYAGDTKLYLYDTEGNFLREEIYYEDGRYIMTASRINTKPGQDTLTGFLI